MSPTHSVVIPVLNGDRYIAECLDSVLSQLGADDELIVRAESYSLRNSFCDFCAFCG